MKRFLTGCLAVLLAVPALTEPAGAVTATDPLPYGGKVSYEIKRGDMTLGWHRIKFDRQGDDLIVDIALDMEVKLGFITLYDYTHRNREIWRDGKLVRIETRTDDDGTPWIASGELTAEGFFIRDGVDGGRLLEAPLFPTSYWDRRFTEQDAVFGTQKGIIREIETRKENDVYVIRKDLMLDLVYDDQGRWQGGIATTKDGEITWLPGVPPQDDDTDWWAFGLEDLPLDELDLDKNNQLALGAQR
ncbi:MAG: DUF6134 family protein [Alphaproteobacteria bacterium]|nr:DUF6134 family protein [Alphaproteobacteria bacterium]